MFRLVQDLLEGLVRSDDGSVLIGSKCLQGAQLIVEKRDRHEVLGSVLEPCPQDLARGVEMDEEGS